MSIYKPSIEENLCTAIFNSLEKGVILQFSSDKEMRIDKYKILRHYVKIADVTKDVFSKTNLFVSGYAANNMPFILLPEDMKYVSSILWKDKDEGRNKNDYK